LRNEVKLIAPHCVGGGTFFKVGGTSPSKKM